MVESTYSSQNSKKRTAADAGITIDFSKDSMKKLKPNPSDENQQESKSNIGSEGEVKWCQ